MTGVMIEPFPVALVVAIVLLALFILLPRGGANWTGHRHDFLPVEWDDAVMGSPFWCFSEDNEPVEHYARRCSCGEVRIEWVGPEADRDPEAPQYRGSWTPAKFMAWARAEAKRKTALAKREGRV